MEASQLPEEYKEYMRIKKEYNKRLIAKIKKKRTQENPRQVRIKCVNCNRAVGMRFNENGIDFQVKCGDTKRPCNLNIKAKLPKYTRVLDRIRAIQGELNDILGELKNIKVRIMYTQEVEKRDPKMFNDLKKKAIRLMKEHRELQEARPQYPVKLEDVGVIPGDFFDKIKFYEENKRLLQDYYIFERPQMSYDKSGNIEFPPEEENVTTLISNLDLLTTEV